MPSRKFEKAVRKRVMAETTQITLNILASKVKRGGWPIIFAQNNRIILPFAFYRLYSLYGIVK
jgi:hypothetical protein